MNNKQKIGKLGEDIAVDFLLKKGYKILQRNWRFQKAEIDIIAEQDPYLVFVEVKCRSTELFGPPEQYLDSNNLESELRCDVM